MLKKLIRVPWLFFLIAACIGLILRWHYYQPIESFIYSNWLHAHSHVMFLGWVLNALMIGFVHSFLPESVHNRYIILFIILNILIFGMLISFPLQGYGLYSIIISTLHTIVVIIFCKYFFNDTHSYRKSIEIQLARASLLFFIISAIGPFVVGVLAANDLKQSEWYHLAVYFYLHFQYNGVFMFGILALFFHLLKVRKISFQLIQAKRFCVLLFISCFPAYALSTLWTNPPGIVNGVGFIAALGQVVAFYYFLKAINFRIIFDASSFPKSSRILFGSAFISFGVKIVLQLISAFPSIAALSYEIRFYVIAYLHLVLIGIISFFLIAWYNEWKIIEVRKEYIYTLLVGFIISELIMIGVGVWPNDLNVLKWLTITTILLIIGIAGIIFDSFISIKT